MAAHAQDAPALGEELAWVEAEGGYGIAIAGESLVFRNPRGKVLEAVPRELRHGELAGSLERLSAWLVAARPRVARQAERLMLEQVVLAPTLLECLWRDRLWRAALVGAVVALDAPDDADWTPASRIALLAGFDATRGVQVIDVDAGRTWFRVRSCVILHPLAIPDLEAMRRVAAELDLRQGIPQLARTVHERPLSLSTSSRAIDRFAGALFPQSRTLTDRVKLLGFTIAQGSARVLVRDQEALVEARYELGLPASGEGRATTGVLEFVDERGVPLALDAVPALAYSEGLRMATSIHDGRRR